MIVLKNITIRNFLSVGAVTQTVNFNNKELTLIVGENLDLGGNGSSNGVGKSTLVQAISYVLFGTPINKIRKDNLINRTNGKGMLCTLDFSVNGIDYRIERGRKANILKFYINSNLQESKDEAQGESKETQLHIEHAIGMSADMFKQIVILNTYTEPFLGMSSNDQRNIIEQLLGITLLTEKAELLKEQIRKNKDQIQQEDFKIKAIEEANKRVQEQINSTKRRQRIWLAKQEEDLAKLALAYDDLTKIDIEKELQAHKDLISYNKKRLEIENLNKLIAQCVTLEAKEDKIISKLKKEIEDLKTNKCYACGQDLHDEKHGEVLAAKEKALEEAGLQWVAINTQHLSHRSALEKLGDLGKIPKVFYDSESEAIKHSSQIDNILNQIENKSNEIDPYSEQIAEMENQALQEINFDKINELTKFGDHLKFLLDLLSSKDSFIRKKIIDQNLSYLNSRLTHYLDKIGLPHSVVFKNDLSVEITELGRELDFHNLSRGEMNRLILGLSFAFRDVWENLYYPINTLFIDELIDNGTDTIGTENTLAILKDMNRRRNKSIWMISHKDDLINRVNSVLKAVKEGGFTSYISGNDQSTV
jgi:DNA repair exonuclease SbcCD ATPase subunit